MTRVALHTRLAHYRSYVIVLPDNDGPGRRYRDEVVRLLTDAGIAAGVALAPVLPGLTDAPRDLSAVLAAAREAGATHAWSNVLNLRAGTREHFLSVLEREWPAELARYRRLYPAGGSGYLSRHERSLDFRTAATRGWKVSMVSS